jgi:hypothetical protein
MPKPLTDTDIDAQIFGSNSETDLENGSTYVPSSDDDEEDAIADDDSEQTSEEKKIQNLLFGDPIYLVGLLM